MKWPNTLLVKFLLPPAGGFGRNLRAVQGFAWKDTPYTMAPVVAYSVLNIGKPPFQDQRINFDRSSTKIDRLYPLFFWHP